MNTTTAGTRFPIRLDPLPGEAFDGWLDAYAQRLLMPGRELGHALSIQPRLLRLRGASVAKGDPTLDAEQIAARACGIDPAAVRGLWFGLGRYDDLISERVARPATGRRVVGWFARVLRPMVSSPYCPSCLRDTAGRWLAAWRLPWYLACPTHQTMLASACPACGGTQRYAGLRATHLHELLTTCSRPTAPQAGTRDHRCRQDLTVTTEAAPAPAGLTALQAEMAAILDPTLSNRDARGLVDRLVDLLIIATRVGLDPATIDRDRRNMQTILAGPLVEAHRALSDPHGPGMRTIATNDPARWPGALSAVWDGVSPQLAAVLLGHRDRRLSATQRLRYRSMTGSGRRPEGTDPALRLRTVPFAIWPDWSIRLRPATMRPDTFRIAAAIALCLPGATASVRSIRGRWPGRANEQRMVKFGRLIMSDPHGTAILAALCVLADRLDRDGSPIDYQRRRELASQIELLDHNSWTIMSRAGGTPAGDEPKLGHARLWLWETLTGSLPRQAPAELRRDCPEHLTRHWRFVLALPSPTVQRLNEHARRLLDSHGRQHEPLTWSPTTDITALGQLPGPDPDAIDPRSVRAAIADQPTPQHAADKLGITLEHLRYTVRNHPPETADPSARTTPDRVRFAAVLGIDQLRALISQGHSLRQIAASYEINRHTLHDELVAHGIPTPPRNRRQPPSHGAANQNTAPNQHAGGGVRGIGHLSPTTAPPRGR